MGNAYTKGNPTMYPGCYHSVFAVGSIAEDRVRSEFSNTGGHIDLCAPGSNVLSTFPTRRAPPHRTKRGYAALSGTSMATAHVSGAAALVAAKHPDWSAGDIAEHLRATARRLPEMGKKKHTPQYGAGLLDLAAALR
jgi:subtilisin family serine protease